MRKFAMTLLLGLGMATASFAGNVETAEAAVEVRKEVVEIAKPSLSTPDFILVTHCGIVVIIPGLSDEETWDVDVDGISNALCN